MAAEREAVAAFVTGLGVLGPCGRGTEALWRSLLSGSSNRRKIAHFETHGSAAARAGLVPGEEGRAGDPERLLELTLAAAGDALADAGLAGAREAALVVGTTDADACGLAERAAERLSLRGEAIVVGAASASGGSALCVARDMLAAGDAETVVAVGADRVTQSAFHGLRALRTLSAEGCRPFSAERRGIAVSEGAAAMVLQGEGQSGASSPPQARLRGCGSSNATDSLAVSGVAGIAGALEAALADARLDRDEVDLVNAHGPGTRQGDVVEVEALRSVFGEGLPGVALVSTKGVLWHWQGAAGIVEALACVLSIAKGTVTPTHGAAPLDQAWHDLDLVLEPRRAHPRVAVSISCGLGGINTAAVLEAP